MRSAKRRFERAADFIISTTQQPVLRPAGVDGVYMASWYTPPSSRPSVAACADGKRMMESDPREPLGGPMTQRDRNLDVFRPAQLEPRGGVSRRSFIAHGTAAAAAAFSGAAWAEVDFKQFKRVPTQYIAALAEPDATSGTNAETWGLWRQDPGPRGVRLKHFDRLENGVAPAGWHFDKNAWWVEEHGLLMEAPDFPMPAGRYLVTGDREVTSVLTVDAPSADGRQRWALSDGATLYDVTHLRCRSAVYTPAKEGGSCSPAAASEDDFPVAPGAAMPPVAGCAKQDYQVLIVIGVPNAV
jgi:hypothetical protein